MAVGHSFGAGKDCKDPACWCRMDWEQSTLKVQVDGNHYKDLAIQPAEYSFKNKLNWHQGEIIKYVTRYKNKNGKVDLEKAKHLIDMLIEFEYGSS